MVFSSVTFLLYFFPIFYIIYFFLPRKIKNIYLLGSSIFFYAWGAPKFIFAILIATTIIFYLVKTIDVQTNLKRRRLLFYLAIGINLGLLIYFKYFNFFIENVNFFISKFGIEKITWIKVVLPIGISFYTFESLTYIIDVYRKAQKPLNNFLQFQLYILLFPKLIAGPIIRYHEISDQISNRFSQDNIDKKLTGFFRFCLGLSKKVFIANVLAVKADEVFLMSPSELTTSLAWLGLIAYSFQIYYDFSAYSDMAIGLGRMLGFSFPENFNFPYISKSITEFWKRWHITLGDFLRDYIYFPMTLNFKKPTKNLMLFALFFVFLISGIWHGAGWTFIVWGAYHGILLVLEKIFLLKFYNKIGNVFSNIITFFLVLFGWIFFRAESFNAGFAFCKKLFAFDGMIYFGKTDLFFWISLLIAFLFSFIALFPIEKRINTMLAKVDYNFGHYVLMAIVFLPLFFLSIAAISSGNLNPFIYFRF